MLAPEILEEKRGLDIPMVVDYREVLARKHQLLRDVLLGDIYDDTAREKAHRIAQDKKRLGESPSSES